jgi:hypothetical protein
MKGVRYRVAFPVLDQNWLVFKSIRIFLYHYNTHYDAVTLLWKRSLLEV